MAQKKGGKKSQTKKSKQTVQIPEEIRSRFIKPATFRHLVRIVHKDIKGDFPLIFALTNIKGIGFSLAYAICKVLNLDPNMPIGLLNDEQIKTIEEVAKNPTKFGIPWWMVNRPYDRVTGEHLHYVGPELEIIVKKDIDLMKSINSWKGLRHSLGLKVRGQRTRTTGRKGLTVGVARKKK